MKEATGELSTTVITVVAIAAISSLFIVFLYPQLKASIILNQACSNGPGYTYTADDSSYTISCPGTSKGKVTTTWTCTYTPKGGGARSKTCDQN